MSLVHDHLGPGPWHLKGHCAPANADERIWREADRQFGQRSQGGLKRGPQGNTGGESTSEADQAPGKKSRPVQAVKQRCEARFELGIVRQVTLKLRFAAFSFHKSLDHFKFGGVDPHLLGRCQQERSVVARFYFDVRRQGVGPQHRFRTHDRTAISLGDGN